MSPAFIALVNVLILFPMVLSIIDVMRSVLGLFAVIAVAMISLPDRISSGTSPC